MVELADGAYDVFVVDVEESGDEDLRVELAITSGAHKGELVALRATRAMGDVVTLLGLPGTLRVIDGTPHLDIQR